MKNEIKKQDIGTVSAILVSIVEIGKYLGKLGSNIKIWWKERKEKKKYKEADKAAKEKNVKKINDILSS